MNLASIMTESCRARSASGDFGLLISLISQCISKPSGGNAPPCGYWYSTTAAMAAATSSMMPGAARPRQQMNRSTSTPRNCSTSTADSFSNPLRWSGIIRTCQRLPANTGFQPVIGATSLIGSRPIASELITMAGLCFWISAPRVGLKSTSQISPRFGVLKSILDKVASLHLSPLGVLGVVGRKLLRLLRQNPTPLFQRQFHKRPALDDR